MDPADASRNTEQAAREIVDRWVRGFTRISDLPSDASCRALRELIAQALLTRERAARQGLYTIDQLNTAISKAIELGNKDVEAARLEEQGYRHCQVQHAVEVARREERERIFAFLRDQWGVSRADVEELSDALRRAPAGDTEGRSPDAGQEGE